MCHVYFDSSITLGCARKFLPLFPMQSYNSCWGEVCWCVNTSICLLSCSTYTSFRLEVRYGNKIYKKVTAITPSQASMWVTELVQLSTEMSEKQHFFFHHQLWDKKSLIQSVTDLVSLTNIACLLDAVWWGIWATTFILACSWCLSVGHPLGHRFRMRSPKVLNWLQINCV